MQIDVIDQTGKKVSTTELNPAIFEAPINAALIAQAIRVRLTNARAGTANTKIRDEVSGGGRKPWRQKGTGRARHGSIRSPQWRGGGVVHGPRVRLFHLSMPKQMRRRALFAALAGKLRDNQIMILDSLTVEKAKTSGMKAVITALDAKRSSLIVLPAKSEEIERSARNLSDIKVTTAAVLHPYEILKYQNVIILKDSLPVLEQTFLKTETSSAKPVVEKKSTKESSKATAANKQDAAKTAAKKPASAKKPKATAAKEVEAKPAASKRSKAKAEK